MQNNRRGDVAIFVEVFAVILIIFGFLVAVKLQSKPKVAIPEAYPHTDTAAVSEAVITSRKTLTSPVVPTYEPKIPQDEIIYTDAGFFPDILDVKNTNRVMIFRNKSSHLLWVASDPHPQHTGLPSLNQGQGVKPGGVYWYAFSTKAGVYGYHNHLQPDHHGTIIAR